MSDDLKIENEKLIKERDDYKIKKEKLINEIEIIKLNHDKIYNIKTLTNNNTNKLKNEISSLKKEKEILDEKNEELQKRIKSLDRKNSRNKSLKMKSKTVSNLNKNKFGKFMNLKIIKIKEFTLPINSSIKNKNLGKKNTPKKGTKKVFINKFKKLSINNKVVDICINKKSGNSNKKIKKKVIKFKKVKQCSKIVDLLIKSTPKPLPKPKKKKFVKLKSINKVVNIFLKPKINIHKFKSNKLKISSKINSLNINSINKIRKKIEMKKTYTEFSLLVKPIHKEKEIKEENNIAKEKNKKDDNNALIFKINKLENINFEGKSKTLILDIKKIESFSLKEKQKQKLSKDNNLTIVKKDSVNFNKIKKINKKPNLYSIAHNYNFNLISKLKLIKTNEISKNNFITLDGLKKCFNIIENKKNDSFEIISKPKPIIIKKIYEISKMNSLSFFKTNKINDFKKEKGKSFMYAGIKKFNLLKKETKSSFFFKPKKKFISLNKSVNEQSNQNKPKIYSFFSSFLKGKKNNLIPMRILQVQYKRSKKDKLASLNKKNNILSQIQFSFLSTEKKNKEIKYSINKACSFNFQKFKPTKKYNIININSFSIENKINLSSNNDPEKLKEEENLKILISKLNKSIDSKNEEIKKLEKEKEDIESANKLFNDSSNEQIESLSKNVSTLKEKNKKLNDEIEKLKEDINNNAKKLEEKNKEYEEYKNNLNKTIDELTKENSKLKLELFKRGTESETDNTSKNKPEEINSKTNNDDKLKEYEKQIETLKEDLNKMRQSKIIETNQLKIEITKNKVEMKRLTNQIKKLESEGKETKKNIEDNIETLKINDLNKDDNISNEKEEINKLKNEIQSYKNKMTEINVELKKNEDLRHQNILLSNKFQEAQKKVTQANQVLGKVKKYTLCMAYVSQFLGIIKPETEKQIYLANKLKEFTDEYQKEKLNKKNE